MNIVIVLSPDLKMAAELSAIVGTLGFTPCIEPRADIAPQTYGPGFATFILFDFHSLRVDQQTSILENGVQWREVAPGVALGPTGAVQLAVRCLQAGMHSFLELPLTPHNLQMELGRLALRPQPAEDALDGALGCLSRREVQVLRRVARGLTNKQIAAELGVSPRTVEVYRASLLTKLKVKTTADLIRLAVSSGVLR